MAISLDQSLRLLTLIVFVFYENYDSTSRKVRREYEAMAEKYKIERRLPAILYPLIWFTTKSFVVAFMYMYMEYTISFATNWPYLAVYVAFIVNIMLAKTWMPLFFHWHNFQAAFFVALILASTAWFMFGIVVSGINVSKNVLDMSVLIGLYAAWLTVAVVDNWRWLCAKWKLKCGGGDMKTTVVIPVSTLRDLSLQNLFYRK